MNLPFAEFRPDAATLDTGFGELIRNVYPTSVGYSPIRGKATYSGALSAAPRGFISVQTSDGVTKVFAATATKLWQLASNLTWTDVSVGGGSYNGPGADENWSFAVFDGKLYAANANDDMQVIDIDSGTVFAGVSGSPPRGKYLAVVEAYLVVGCLTSDEGAIAWCDTGDPTDWSTGNADEQSFPDGGPVMGVLGAAKRVIQQRSERLMVHQPGSALVFAFEKIANARGTVAPQSIIEVGESYAYLSEDGFYFNGVPIGKEKVDRYFLDLVNTDRLFAVMGGFDPVRRLFRWAFHTGSATAFDWQLIYSPSTERWSQVIDDVTFIGDAATPGVTLEGLDALYATLEDVAYSLDSRIWEGGRPVFAVFGTDNALAFYEGATLEALMETTEKNLFDGGRALLNGCRPLIDGDTGALTTARAGTRERMAGTVSYGSYASLQASGRVPLRKGGRYHRVGVKVAAGASWTHARGVELGPLDVRAMGLK